jgi:ABC-type multidrug transport system ATPase subunit
MANELFRVVASGTPSAAHGPTFVLKRDDWDDYSHKTTFGCWVRDEAAGYRNLRGVKIGSTTYEAGHGLIQLPTSFDEVPEGYFSLGQSDEYYEQVARLDPEVRDEFLRGLRDLVHDQELFQTVRNLPVTQRSLLRTVSPATVRGKFARLLRGDAPLTKYRLEYTDEDSYNLSFTVEPDSKPPTNIHVLIGRNGVGKTRLLSRMATSIMRPGDRTNGGTLVSKDDFGNYSLEAFAGLVLVSFSAFDSFSPPHEWRDATDPRFAYVGLKLWDELEESSSEFSLMTGRQMKSLFSKSVDSILKEKRALWLRALEHLESDPVFSAIDIANIAQGSSKKAAEQFGSLSSGHKIVLLIITKLVEQVEERTLVLIDEPEAHLHPPLLSALIRSLSDLLIKRNGVAIVATHSPVVLQEVPSECVWIMTRSGKETSADRPEIETFGENVGTLTHEVFGLEVTSSGFYNLLSEAAAASDDYQEAISVFDRMIGGEGRAILRAMVVEQPA